MELVLPVGHGRVALTFSLPPSISASLPPSFLSLLLFLYLYGLPGAMLLWSLESSEE